MASISLVNKTGNTSRVGYLAKVVKGGFDYCSSNDSPIGVIAQKERSGRYTLIKDTGTVKAYVSKHVEEGQGLRQALPGEGVPIGTLMPIEEGGSYAYMGKALESGKGLIKVYLNISYSGEYTSSGTSASTTTVVGGGGGGGGTITDVIGGYGIVSSGGTTPNISLDLSELLADDGTSFAATSYFIFHSGTDPGEKIRTTDVPISTFVNDSGYTANAGTITSVSASVPLTSSGGINPNIALDGSLIPLKAGALLADDWIVVVDAVSNAFEKKLIANIPLGEFNNDEGWASGTVTSVLGGIGIDSDGSTTTPSLSLNLSELIAATDLVTWSATSYLPFQSGTDPGEKIRTTDIPISTWVNDSGFTANLGTVTNVSASVPLASSGGTTPNISFDATSIPLMGGALLAEDYILVTETSDSGAMKRKLISTVPLGEFNNDEGWASGTVESVLGGYGIVSDADSVNPSLSFDGMELDVDILDPTFTSFSASAFMLFAVGAVSERVMISDVPLSYFDNDAGFVTSTGVTSVSGGTGIDVINPSTNPIVTLDVSELAERVGAIDATDRLVGATSAGVNFAETISNIALSKFNNDDGWTSDVSYWTQSGSDIYYSTGDVSIGITGGGYQTWPDRTLVVGATGSQERPNIELHGNLTTSAGSVGALSAHNEQSGSATKCIAQVAFRVTSDLDAGRIVFQTASTAGTLTDRVTIDEVGALSAIGEITAFA